MSQSISNLAVGAKIEVPVLSAYQSRFGAKLVFKIADKNHSGYPANSVTLITEKIIQLMCFDAIEANNSNSGRKQYGNNRYLHSNLLQWLNSNAAAGAWYSAQHSADAPPTNANVYSNYNEYDAWAGFLAMIEPKFVAELLDTTQTVVKNTVTDGGSYETVTSKMFLASTTEVGLANENSIAEGSLLALFSNDASRVAYPTSECVSNSEYTNSSFATSKGWYWWLRTPHSSYAHFVRHVVADGSLGSDFAYIGSWGVRPLCNLSSSILVSDTTNSDGNYEIIYNTAPSAPSGITAPAQAYSGQNIEVSCAEASDPDGDALT
ncbi:MAG: fibronectin type III domain-containing protein, partial [Clostridia bacterium]|nr:fibronectin type III domain-containing protein [Clostridia bacterium]